MKIYPIALAIPLLFTTPVLADSTTDAFVEDFKLMAASVERRATVREVVLRIADESPQTSIAMAQAVCGALRRGYSMEDIAKVQVDSITVGPGLAQEVVVRNYSIVNFLAPRYFCPEFINR